MTITRAPASRRMEPRAVFQIKPRNITAKIMVSMRLHLSIGTALDKDFFGTNLGNINVSFI